ncbi:MAG: hypothetical protein JWQ96_3542 [Segetibacter sp.]|nr:hypothetical protein [Segetibacter sp.]
MNIPSIHLMQTADKGARLGNLLVDTVLYLLIMLLFD